MRIDYFNTPLKEGDVIAYKRGNDMEIVKIDSFDKKDNILFKEYYNFNYLGTGAFYTSTHTTLIKTNRIFKIDI